MSKKGSTAWNKGLTKETDSRIKSGGRKLGCKPWNKGLKYTCKEGILNWNTGLTKETDPRVMAQSLNVSKTVKRLYEEKGCKMGAKKGTHLSKKRKAVLKEQAIKRWEDPEYAKMMSSRSLEANQSVCPNQIEHIVIDILEKIHSSFKFVGDKSVWILGANPDFINESTKQIIEVFGCYWHGCPKHFHDLKKQKRNVNRVKKFVRAGYSVLIIWEHELRQIYGCRKPDVQKTSRRIIAFESIVQREEKWNTQ